MIVHYVRPDRQHVLAVLKSFSFLALVPTDRLDPQYRMNVRYSASGEVGTWHWPECS